MKDNKLEQELARQLRAQQHEAEQDHRDICDQTNMISKRSMWGIVAIIFILTISASTSIYKHKLYLANKAERDMQRLNKEQFAFVRGLFYDDKNILLKAQKYEVERLDGEVRGACFDRDWNYQEKKLFIETAHALGHTNTLDWVRSQPNWQNELCKDISNLVESGVDRYGSYTAQEWRKKYYDLKKHHYDDLHNNDYDQLAGDYEISESKLNLLLAWYWDDPAYLNSVNWVHINEKWEKAYELRLKEAPNVEKALFEQKTKTATKKNLKNNALH